MTVEEFVARWARAGASERANKDSFLVELCDVLGVERPAPRTGDRTRDTYVFEADAVTTHAGGQVTIGKMDLYRAGAFVLEAKQGGARAEGPDGAGGRTNGTGAPRRGPGGSSAPFRGPGGSSAPLRGTPAWNILMRDAFGQALAYARTLDRPPPFLLVADLGYCFDLYASFDGTLHYRAWPDAQGSRLYVADLERHRELLRQVWLDPQALDPAKQKVKVTRAIAELVARLSTALEARGHEPTVVARFLMRCLFTMFAEDVGLLADQPFTRWLRERWVVHPEQFPEEVVGLWRTMDTGGYLPKRVPRFNGGLFADPVALPLTRDDLEVLLAAADCAWDQVEPAIFGTLLERALSPRERHRLGAHYTPRAYVERLVRPALEEPLRAEWDLVRVGARQYVHAGRVEEARTVVADFHHQLCEVRVLDPACGTGNFLYVALDVLERLEGEVLALLRELGDERLFLQSVSPRQFLGIEKKPWAREIAELVLWIGHLSWQMRRRGQLGELREPILHDFGNIECRDAVVAWDGVEPVLDEAGAPRTRWDGETMKLHPVTGREVPDETARVPIVRYLNPRPAPWPAAEFIVGNPPFIGNKRMRDALGDGYTEALRAAWPDVPSTADLVMYWWHKAGLLTAADKVRRFGFITTNSLTQVFNRGVVESLLGEGKLAVRWAVPDHPWVVDGAAVRIAMTVAEPANASFGATLVRVLDERDGPEAAEVTLETRFVDLLHPDLRAGANVAGAVRLQANVGMSFQGMNLVGEGFRLTPGEVTALGYDLGNLPPVIRPYKNARDLTQGGAERYVIDLYGLTAEEAAVRYPPLYQHLLVHVRPERESNNREAYRKNWWLFGEGRRALRAALVGLDRMIVTPITSKHRFFVFEPVDLRPDCQLHVVCSGHAADLAVLSSRHQACWGLAAGSTLEDRPRWRNQTCFDPFPFPDLSDPATHATLADLGERLDAHRKARQALHPELTLTGMYNVLEKLRAGEPLTPKERVVHDQGLVSVLRELHDQIDAAVAAAYGWPVDLDDESLLARLVALNAERAAEERAGRVRWLRPELQRPQAAPTTVSLGLPGLAPEPEAAPSALAWPKTLSDRIAAVRAGLSRLPTGAAVEDVARLFKGAPRKDVEAILDSLAALGLILALATPEGRRWRAA